jgi:uroporphyrinogen-III synthase
MNTLKQYTVLVTRPVDQSDKLCQLIKLADGEVIAFPTLQITPSSQLSKYQIQDLLSWASHVVFISRNAVIYLDRLIDGITKELNHKTLYATGKGTAMALEKLGMISVFFPSQKYGSEGLLELESMSSANIKDKNFLIIRGEQGRELLRAGLQARGANVKYASTYCSKRPDAAPEIIESIWQASIPDIIVATSNQGLKNLIEMTPERHQTVLFSRKLVVMSNRIADTALKAGFIKTPIVAEYQSDEGLVEAIQHSLE